MDLGKKILLLFTCFFIMAAVILLYLLRDEMIENTTLKNDMKNTEKILKQNLEASKDSVVYYKDKLNQTNHGKLTLAQTIDELKIKYNRLYRQYQASENQVLYLNIINGQLRDSLNKMAGKMELITTEGMTYISWADKFTYPNDTLYLGGKFNFEIIETDKEIIINPRPSYSSLWYNMTLNLVSSLEYDSDNDRLYTMVKSTIDTNTLKISNQSNIDPEILKRYYNYQNEITDSVKTVSHRFSIGLQGGYGLGYDLYRGEFSPALFYFGVGLNWKLLEF